MGIIVPRHNAALIKTYQRSLFHDTQIPQSERIYTFYLLVRPLLKWLVPVFSEYNLERNEVESEIYLFCAELFKKFNPAKSSIIPYLEKYIPWTTNHWIRRLKKNNPFVSKNSPKDVQKESYTLQEQYYWHPEKILFEERYVGKVFTKAEKYVISILLTTDQADLTQSGLARIYGLSRTTMINQLKKLSKLEEIKP